MRIDTFHDMYLTELQEIESMEDQIAAALPRITQHARDERLKQALNQYLSATQRHKTLVEAIIQKHGGRTGAHRDQTVEAMIREAEKVLAILPEPALRDAGLISSVQRIAHYEMACYGTGATYAGLLTLPEDQQILRDILEEEKAVDVQLSDIASASVDPAAARVIG